MLMTLDDTVKATPLMLDFANPFRSFLQPFWQGLPGDYVCLAAIRNKRPGEQGSTAIEHLWLRKFDDSDSMRWSEVDDFVDRWQERGRSIYFSHATYDERGDRTAANVVATRAVVVDADTRAGVDRLLEFTRLIAPSWLVSSSPKKLQAEWLLEEHDVQAIKTLSTKLKTALGTDNVQDPSRVMRLPGTLNMKPEYQGRYPMARLRSGAGLIVPMGLLQGALARVTPVVETEAEDETPVKVYYWLKKLPVELRELAKGLEKDSAGNWVTIPPKRTPGRSEAFKRIVMECIETHRMPPKAVLAIAEYANERLMGGRYSRASWNVADQVEKFSAEAQLARLARVKVAKWTGEQRKVEWVWDKRIPRRGVTLVEGDGGLGKTTANFDLLARLSSGRPMPFDKVRREPEKVLILAPEEDADVTINPKLADMGADMDNVITIRGIEDEHGNISAPQLPRDVAFLRDLIEVHKPKVVYLEPLVTFLDDTLRDDGRGNRIVLQTLKTLAEQYDISVIVLRHWNKTGEGDIRHRGIGSIEVRNAVRCAFSYVEMPDEPGLYGMLRQKSSWSAEKNDQGEYELFTYRLVNSTATELGVIQWHEVRRIRNIQELSNPKRTTQKESKLDAAKAFTRAYLKDRTEPTDAGALKGAAFELDHTDKTLTRAWSEMLQAGEIARWSEGNGKTGKHHYIQLLNIEELE